VSQARFAGAARREFLAEVAYYREIQPALAERFTAAVEKAVERAVLFPFSGSPTFAGTRRILVKGFPFSVIYRPENDELYIVAIAHHSRKPGYWSDR
jgi:toxin ParE1/3/4